MCSITICAGVFIALPGTKWVASLVALVLGWRCFLGGTQEQAEKQQAKGAKGHGEEAKDVDGAEAEEVPGSEARAGDDGAKAIQIGYDGMFSTADYFHQSNDCDNDGGNGAKKEKPAPHHNECGDAPHDEQRGVNKGQTS